MGMSVATAARILTLGYGPEVADPEAWIADREATRNKRVQRPRSKELVKFRHLAVSFPDHDDMFWRFCGQLMRARVMERSVEIGDWGPGLAVFLSTAHLII